MMAVDQIARMMALDAAQQGGGGGTSNYNQLTNKPSINGVTLTGNKTTSDLGIVENVQADWDETDSTAPSYIQNKPNIPSGVVVDTTYDGTSENAQAGTAVAQAVSGKANSADLATVATSGSYNDLSNTPTIPTVDQTYDATSTNAQSGTAVAQALQTIPSVTVDQTYNPQSTNAQSGTAVASAISGKISATDYATQITGGTVKAWTTTDGSDTILHLATQ